MYIPPVLQGSMGSIACIAWKGDTLVLGDVDGNLNFWDLKARLSRYLFFVGFLYDPLI